MNHRMQAYSAPTARERLKHRMRPLPLTQLPLSERPTSLPQAWQCLIEARPGALSVEALSPDLFLLPSITTQAVLGLLPHTEVGF